LIKQELTSDLDSNGLPLGKRFKINLNRLKIPIIVFVTSIVIGLAYYLFYLGVPGGKIQAMREFNNLVGEYFNKPYVFTKKPVIVRKNDEPGVIKYHVVGYVGYDATLKYLNIPYTQQSKLDVYLYYKEGQWDTAERVTKSSPIFPNGFLKEELQYYKNGQKLFELEKIPSDERPFDFKWVFYKPSDLQYTDVYLGYFCLNCDRLLIHKDFIARGVELSTSQSIYVESDNILGKNMWLIAVFVDDEFYGYVKVDAEKMNIVVQAPEVSSIKNSQQTQNQGSHPTNVADHDTEQDQSTISENTIKFKEAMEQNMVAIDKTGIGEIDIKLLKAAKDLDINSIKSLLDQGADPNVLSSRGFSLLGFAVNYGQEDLVKVLLDYGGNPEIEDPNGEPLIFYAVDQAGDVNFNVLQMVLDSGANPNVKSQLDGRTPLHNAVFNYGLSTSDDEKFTYKKIIEYLLNQGANPNLSKDGESVFMQIENLEKSYGLDLKEIKELIKNY
jgi:hypothetical protein